MSSGNVRGRLWSDGNQLKLRHGATNEVVLAAGANVATATFTLPTATDTLVGRVSTDTLQNKTFVAPVLGTPASGTLTNCTGLPISTGVAGLGTGVATWLATPSSANLASAITDETGSGALVFANTPTLVTPILGTPTSGTLTNCTGLPVSGLVAVTASRALVSDASGYVSAATTTSTQIGYLSAATGTTGTTSTNLVFSTSPTLVTPTLGVASATSINKVAITAPATSATFTLADGKTLTVSNTLTFTGTDASSVAFGTGGTVLYSGGALGTPSSGTLTNCTGLPISTGVSGLGTGVATAAATAVNTSGGFATSAVTSLASLATVGTITSGTWNAGAVTSSGVISNTDTTESTSTTTGAFKTAGGLGVAKNLYVGGVLVAGSSTAVQHKILTGSSGATATFVNGEIHFGNSDASYAIPTITGATTTDHKNGLYISAGASNTNTNGDMVFDVRESDTSAGTDFSTLTSKGFVWSRYGTEVMSLTREGTLVAGSGTAATHILKTQGGASSGEFRVNSTSSLTSGGAVYSTVRDNGVLVAEIGAYYSSGAGQTCGYFGTSNNGGTEYFFWQNTGKWYTGSTGSNIGTTTGTVVGDQTSDERLKANIQPTKYGLNTVLQLEPIDFEMDGKAHVGFGAQRTQPIVPEAVYDTGDLIVEDEPNKMAMSYHTMIPILVKAVQELKAENDAIKARVEALENV